MSQRVLVAVHEATSRILVNRLQTVLWVIDWKQACARLDQKLHKFA
jgi:hypothetical protein